jgi:integrase
VKAFVNWLYDAEAIAAVPRIMRRLLISKPPARIEVFTMDEVKNLLAAASQRTRLYILLALNTGATQVDISDLKVEEVDWTEGRIVRRRSKTKDEEHVPVVNYRLWPETIELLKLERATEGDRALVNANGSPLLCQEIKADGKLRKCDNVKNSFDRLKTKTGINKSFKLLRKTSATLLCDSEFMGLEGLFLGHAPGSVAAKHYARTPQQRFDQAVMWLGQQYGLVEPTPAAVSEQSAVAPAAPSPSPEPAAEEGNPRQRRSRSRRVDRRTQRSP